MIRKGKTKSRRPGKRAGLSREQILAAAQKIVEQDGFESITIRGIARELDIRPNALYTYFPDKVTLLDELLDKLVGEIIPSNAFQDDWEAGLVKMMESTRSLVLTHPHFTALFLSRPGGSNGFRLGEMVFQLLDKGGVHGKDAVEAFRVLMVYTLGFAAQEVPRAHDSQREARRDRGKEILASFAPHELPLTRALHEHLAHHPDDEDFQRGLRWLLRGIRELAAKSRLS